MPAKDRNTTFLHHPYWILLLFLLVAYFPLLLPFFHIKNDFVTQNLPTRFFISESLYSNTFPWWNPYINFGIPQYGDMNNGFWNPILWVNATVFGYNMLTLTIEEMFYIFLGGIGAYRLGKELELSREVTLVCAISYMGGGYVLGHLQHLCWITGVAFFPFLFQQLLKTLNTPSFRNFLLGGIFSFLFVSSTHPGLIIGSLYFFLFLFCYELIIAKRLSTLKTCKTFFLFFITSAICSMIVIVSNIEVIGQMTRGIKVSLQDSLQNPTTLQCYLSLLFPFSVHKGVFFNTDISMRNVCIGTALLPGLVYFIKRNRRGHILYFSFVLMFFILLSSGGWFKTLAYYYLPLLGHVRLNGEFTYFVYILLIFGGGIGLNKLILSKDVETNIGSFISSLLYVAGIALGMAIIQVCLGKSFLYDLPPLNIPAVLQSITFWDLLLLSATFQLLSVVFLKRVLYKKEFLARYSFITLTLIAWGSLPFTGLGSLPRSEVQAIINSTPRGIVKPNLQPIDSNTYIDSRKDSIIGSAAFYSKQIGYPKAAPYPVILYSTERFYMNESKIAFINSRPYIFLTEDTTANSQSHLKSGAIHVRNYQPTFIKATVVNPKSQYLVFLQNIYPRWQVKVNGKSVKSFSSFDTFLTIKLPPGKFDVEYSFRTNDLNLLAILNFTILIGGLIYIAISSFKKQGITATASDTSFRNLY